MEMIYRLSKWVRGTKGGWICSLSSYDPKICMYCQDLIYNFKISIMSEDNIHCCETYTFPSAKSWTPHSDSLNREMGKARPPGWPTGPLANETPERNFKTTDYVWPQIGFPRKFINGGHQRCCFELVPSEQLVAVRVSPLALGDCVFWTVLEDPCTVGEWL